MGGGEFGAGQQGRYQAGGDDRVHVSELGAALAAEDEVRVRVDEAGQHGPASGVHDQVRGRRRRDAGPVHATAPILDDQRRVVDSGETCLVRDKFPYPGKQSGGHSPKSSPGNQQAIPFVWCA